MKMKNYFYDLPDDIQNYILSIRLQSGLLRWRKSYRERNNMMKELLNYLKEESDMGRNNSRIRYYNVMSRDTAKVLKILAKNMTGKETQTFEGRRFWVGRVLRRINRGLRYYNYGAVRLRNYISCEKSFDTIYHKLKKYDRNLPNIDYFRNLQIF